MISVKLGEDVYLEFIVRVGKHLAAILYATGELYRGDTYLRDFPSRYAGGRVSGLINGGIFKSTGDYTAKFMVHLQGMGKREHAIQFRITPSVLGKEKQKAEASITESMPQM